MSDAYRNVVPFGQGTHQRDTAVRVVVSFIFRLVEMKHGSGVALPSSTGGWRVRRTEGGDDGGGRRAGRRRSYGAGGPCRVGGEEHAADPAGGSSRTVSAFKLPSASATALLKTCQMPQPNVRAEGVGGYRKTVEYVDYILIASCIGYALYSSYVRGVREVGTSLARCLRSPRALNLLRSLDVLVRRLPKVRYS